VTGLRTLLDEFYRDKQTMMLRHEAAARSIGQYDANNTYQYILAREEVQLSWIAKAIEDLGGSQPAAGAGQADRPISGRGKEAARALLEQDARDARAFVERWRPRVEAISNARHRGMLRVILGEGLEQERFFEQALAGRTDLLGRRSDPVGPAQGEVLSSRWIE
jgi:hypothetical protein